MATMGLLEGTIGSQRFPSAIAHVPPRSRMADYLSAVVPLPTAPFISSPHTVSWNSDSQLLVQTRQQLYILVKKRSDSTVAGNIFLLIPHP
jgi:hypothetical protein